MWPVSHFFAEHTRCCCIFFGFFRTAATCSSSVCVKSSGSSSKAAAKQQQASVWEQPRTPLATTHPLHPFINPPLPSHTSTAIKQHGQALHPRARHSSRHPCRRHARHSLQEECAGDVGAGITADPTRIKAPAYDEQSIYMRRGMRIWHAALHSSTQLHSTSQH